MYEYAPSLQKTYTKILRGPAKIAHETLRLTPNQISVVSFVLSLIGLAYFYFHYPLMAVIITLIALLLDALDGTIARTYNMKTKLGSIFETYFDGIHEVLLFPALALAGYVHWPIAIAGAVVFLILRIWKHHNQNIFDAGFKRFGVIFGYFLGFEFVLAVTLAWTVFAIFVNIFKFLDKKLTQRIGVKA
jgi:phosphatidylglycerophosphate synthase